LRTGVETATPTLIKDLRASAQKALDGTALEVGLNRAGLIAQSAVKKTITDNTFTSLAQSTLAGRKARGFAGETPLVETGQLLNAISYEVRDKSWR
jgi:hypothetical protein